jgi:cytochrome c oxidase assembly protein subunit 15
MAKVQQKKQAGVIITSSFISVILGYFCALFMKHATFYRIVFFNLIIILLVIVAGSVVRSTQSGMGCPDWPKCFGTYIPPTNMDQVLYSGNKSYAKGQFVKYNDSLWFANQSFESKGTFNYNEWKHYNKHGYTKIVIYQTWIEYINRLLGALLGIFILGQCVYAFIQRKKLPGYFVLSLCLVFLTGFQAWLGKTVVDSNLATVKISIHLAGALSMLLLQLYMLHKLRPVQYVLPKQGLLWLYGISLFVVVQFFLGIVVRQHVDGIAEKLQYNHRGTWLDEVGGLFYVHRSASLLLIALSLYLFFKYKNILLPTVYRSYVIGLLLQLLIGILFIYADFPAVAQPLHLVVSSLVISFLFIMLLRAKNMAMLK